MDLRSVSRILRVQTMIAYIKAFYLFVDPTNVCKDVHICISSPPRVFIQNIIIILRITVYFSRKIFSKIFEKILLIEYY